MTEPARLQCLACQGAMPRLRADDIERRRSTLAPLWRVVDDHHLERDYLFPDFAQALAFAAAVGAIAESEGHHPRLCVEWGRVGISVWTYKMDGLTDADFDLAARIDKADRMGGGTAPCD